MEHAKHVPTTWELVQMEEPVKNTSVKRIRSFSPTGLANSAHHSKRVIPTNSHASKLFVAKDRDSNQVESARHAKPTQEPWTTEKPVLQTSVPRGKSSYKTEPVKTVASTPEPLPTVENVQAQFVPPDRSSKKMDDVLSAIHTPELMLKERVAYHTTATTDKVLVYPVLVSTAQPTRELKELVSCVHLIPVTSDREFCKMVLASTAHFINQSLQTEDDALSQLASQRLSTSTRMVSASNAPSISKPDQMVPHARPTQQRSSQIPKLWHQLQSLYKPLHQWKCSQLPAPLLGATSGLTSNSYLKTKLQAFISINRQET